MNDVPDGLKSKVKLFSDYTSFFSVVKNKEEGTSDLTNDLDMISKLAYNWKMSFNPDPKKPHKRYFYLDKLTRLRNSLPRKSLITIYKAIIRHLDYKDILYNQPNNAAFFQKIESFQYKVALIITGAIQSTSQEKLLEELGHLKHLNPVDG